jgi:DNA polymerase/3'-5' exonuclease PolX
MQVTLEKIWSSSPKDLELVLKQGKVIVVPDTQINKINVALIYNKYNMLTPESKKIVENPNFETTLSQYDELISLDNEPLIKHFKSIIEYYDIMREIHRVKPFKLAIDYIKKSKTKIMKGKELEGIRGIAYATYAEIDEFLLSEKLNPENPTTKRLLDLEAKNPNMKETLKLFKKIHGVGPVKAMDFYNQGARTFEDIGELSLTHAQSVGYKWFYHIQEKIPRSNMDLYKAEIAKVMGNLQWDITGSYRRGEAQSSDIDLVVAGETTIQSIVDRLGNLIIDTLASGPRKFMGIFRSQDGIGRRIDIRLFSLQEWPYAILYNTGSQMFNILCRNKAIELKLTLNEYELKDASGRKYPAQTEDDIFKHLNIEYIPPEKRSY